MIVVTAPNGKIGSHLVAELLSAGEPLRLIARDPGKITGLARDSAEIVAGSMNDPAVLGRAMEGATALFWLVPSPFDAADVREHYLSLTRPAAEAARRHGVSRVVAVSGLYRGTDRPTGPGFAVNAMADVFADAGLHFRALWSANHMENLLRQVALLRQGYFSLPVDPQVRMPLVCVRDVAAVAAPLLRDAAWTGQDGVPVLGPEDLSHNEMADIMAEVLDRPVSFKPVAEQDFVSGMEGRGASHGVAQWLADMFGQGSVDPHGSTPPTVRNLTPTTFRVWCAQVLRPVVESAG